MTTRPLSQPPTACASPLGRHPRSGTFPCDATTLTADFIHEVTPGTLVPFGPSKSLKSLKAALVRLTGDSSWSCYRTESGLQIAVATIGPLRVTAEAPDSETAIERLRVLVLGLEQGRKELANA